MSDEVEIKMIEQLSKENTQLRKAGGLLAQRAMYTVTEYDGLHRLSLAVANWATAVANEGERKEKSNG